MIVTAIGFLVVLFIVSDDDVLDACVNVVNI